MRRKIIFALVSLTLACVGGAEAQYSSVRVNALGLMTGTLNVGLDVAVGERWSIEACGYWNPVCGKAFRTEAKGFSTGARLWRFEPHAGRFFGLQNTTAWYDFGGREKSWRGWLTGVGASCGYSWLLSTQWNISAEFGLGIFYMEDKREKYDNPPFEDKYIWHYRRVVVAPSRAEVACSFLF